MMEQRLMLGSHTCSTFLEKLRFSEVEDSSGHLIFLEGPPTST
jgi:hypothetical protein